MNDAIWLDNNSRSLCLLHSSTRLIDKLIGINKVGSCRICDIGTLLYGFFRNTAEFTDEITEIFKNGS